MMILLAPCREDQLTRTGITSRETSQTLHKKFSATRKIQWKLTEHLEGLDCADDIVLLSHNFRDMQAKVNDLVEESQKVELKVNIEKTRIFA
jgi:hypothetical protein